MKKCLHCGKEFQSENILKKYCSASCRNKAITKRWLRTPKGKAYKKAWTNQNRERMRLYYRKWRKTPKRKAWEKAYTRTQQFKEYQKAYERTPKRRAYHREYDKTLKRKEQRSAWEKTPKRIEYRKKWMKTPKRKAWEKEWKKTPKARASQRTYNKTPKRIAWTREWTRKNPEKIKARQERYYHTSKGKLNRLLKNERRRKKDFIISGRRWEEPKIDIRQFADNRDNVCAYCHKEFVLDKNKYHSQYPHYEHINPLMKFSKINIARICNSCNTSKAVVDKRVEHYAKTHSKREIINKLIEEFNAWCKWKGVKPKPIIFKLLDKQKINILEK